MKKFVMNTDVEVRILEKQVSRMHLRLFSFCILFRLSGVKILMG